jgi:hypothetical protein
VGKAAGADLSYPSIGKIENCGAVTPCPIRLHGVVINYSFYEGCGVLTEMPLKITAF